MSYTTGRLSALREALRKMLGRPLALVLVVGSTAGVLATLALGALALWRAQPLEAPPWMLPQALVLAAGAAGEVDLAAMQAALRKVATVSSADYVGRDAALAELAQRKSLSALGLADLRPNPLPDAFVVRFAAGAAPEAVEAAVAELRKVRNVDGVEYQAELYRRMTLLAQLAGRLALLLGVSLGASLVLGLALSAAYWVRLDRDEVRVLHLLGAEPAVMRRPYVYAGAVSLLVAAALAWWLVEAAGAWLEPALAELARQYSLHWAPNPLPPWAGAACCVGAALLGAVLASAGARLAARALR